MAVEIKVPRLGWSMEEGTFVEWLKRDGEFVESGQPLFAIEGDKAVQDVEAIGSGILRISPKAPESGEPVRVGVTLAFLVAADEPDPFFSSSLDAPTGSASQPEVPQPKSPRQDKPGPEVPRPGTAPSKAPPPSTPGPEVPSPQKPSPHVPGPEIPRPSPSQPEVAPSEQPFREPAPPSARGSQLSRQAIESDGRGRSGGRRISPRAFRVAAELGIEWQDITGTGRGGRVRERDVREFKEVQRQTSASRRNVAARDEADSGSRGTLRRTIAARMADGAQTTAPVTLTTTADATNLVSLRAQFKAAVMESAGVTPGYLAFITKLAARALAEHPDLNQQWIDGRIVSPHGIHIAIAVDTQAGLLAPVLCDVPTLGVREIASRLADLTARAHSAQLTRDELTGGTFTISNLGSYGIDAFTPILNVPQCAILGLGRIERRPAVVGDQIVARDQMTLSLTFDHRIVDGAPAAKFLATLRQAIENPGPWLLF